MLAKCFLDHKTLYFDVSPFKFYVLTEDNKNGSHIVGYFSKEKRSEGNNFNLACIMVFPPYQRRGYGKFLISLSYHFSKLEGMISTPERPLSDMGKVSYKSYWTDTLLNALRVLNQDCTIEQLSQFTFIKQEDIIETLTKLDLVSYWRSSYILKPFQKKLIDDHFRQKDIRNAKLLRQPLVFKEEKALAEKAEEEEE